MSVQGEKNNVLIHSQLPFSGNHFSLLPREKLEIIADVLALGSSSRWTSC